MQCNTLQLSRHITSPFVCHQEIFLFIRSFKMKCSISTRYTQLILLMIGFAILAGSRVIIGVVTVRMMSNVTKEDEDGSVVVIEQAEFDWSATTVGYVESSQFWGWAISQVTAGSLLSYYFPSHRVFGLSALTATSLNLLMPTAIQLGPYAAVAVRFIIGLANGVAVPSVVAVIAKWAPPSERARMSTLGWVGSYAGPALALPVQCQAT